LSNAQKIWLARSLSQIATARAQDAIQLLGKALPATIASIDGAIATVNFEVLQDGYNLPQVTCPIAGSEYIRLPLQVGTKGVVYPCDVYIDNMSGLSDGTPDLTQAGNLSALVFFPIGNVDWSIVDKDTLVLTGGDHGAILRNSDGSSSVVVSNTQVTLADPSHNTNLELMYTQFDALVTAFNNHVHAVGGTTPTVPFSGNIVN
jgi:hypothetical protein